MEIVIMDYRETNLNFLCDDLIREYGKEQGELLYTLICEKYSNLCERETQSDNNEMNEHIFKRLLPTIGVYITLIENGFTKEEALMIADKEIQRNAHYKTKENARLAKIPFTYGIFKLFAKSHMKKKYPMNGFRVEWKRYDAKEIHFDIVRCIYKDMCEKYHCPELCVVFCQSDLTAFAGYEPKIKFERLGTIGKGVSRCDFHFIHGN